MSRARWLELREMKKLLEDHQPILDDREKILSKELSEEVPELEHVVIDVVYSYSQAKKTLKEVIKNLGLSIAERAVPKPSVEVDDEFDLEIDAPEYSLTMTEVEVDLMARQFQEVLRKSVEIVKQQNKVREILDELEDVRRKNNAIKHALIPDIVAKMKDIENKLEQEELDEKIRLMFIEI